MALAVIATMRGRWPAGRSDVIRRDASRPSISSVNAPRLAASERAEQHQGQLGIELAYPPAQLQPVHRGHVHVENGKVKACRAANRFGSRGSSVP